MRPTTTSTPRAWPSSTYVTSANIEYHMALGRRLRAEAISAGLRSLADGLRTALTAARGRVVGGQAGSAVLPTSLRSPLAAIRSSAETLRDNPDLSPAQQARFIHILIEEEQRLERMIAGAFGERADLQSR